MGMFDNVRGYECPCPKCGTKIWDWQSKDGPCNLLTLQPWEVHEFHGWCQLDQSCKTWVSFLRERISDKWKAFHRPLGTGALDNEEFEPPTYPETVDTNRRDTNRRKAEYLVARWLNACVTIVSEEGDGQMHWRGPETLITGITQLLNDETIDLRIPMNEEAREFLASPSPKYPAKSGPEEP